MVAVAHPSGSRSAIRHASNDAFDRRPAVDRRPGDRGHLRLVVDNDATSVDDRPLLPVAPGTAIGLAVAALVIFGGLFLVRAGQGPAEVGTGEAGASNPAAVAAPVAAPGDLVIVAKPGDTLWSVALQVAPGSDPRPVVDVLVDANGGEGIRAGQQIIVPEQLLD